MNNGTTVENHPHQIGHQIWPACYEVVDEEPALLLIERNEMRPDNTGFNRYQTIFVWRGNGLAKYMEDMGPAELHLAPPLDVPGGDPAFPAGDWLETVDSLRDHAGNFREYLKNRQLTREVPDLIKGFHDYVDQENLRNKHKSVSGKHYKVER